MEPVPETERMEAFRSAPRPSLRSPAGPPMFVASLTPLSPRPVAAATDPDDYLRRLPSLRRSSESASPLSSPLSSPGRAASPSLPYRPRTTSPLSGHTRSRSTASIGSLFPPAMSRTQSMPGVNGAGHLQYGLDPRLSSSLTPLARPTPPPILTRTPRKAAMEEVFPSSPTRLSVIHDPDRDRRLLERNSSPNLGVHTSPALGFTSPVPMASLPVARTRRPASPYRRIASAGAASTASAQTTTTATDLSLSPPPTSFSSPSYRPYETALSSSSYGSSVGMLSSSSVPSTPTSTRSRSPSISSLETIPDSPDAEEAALQAERIAQLKADADADAADGDAKGRSSLDVPTRGRTLAFGPRDKRKRWSVCGAERRGDLDLETIWED